MTKRVMKFKSDPMDKSKDMIKMDMRSESIKMGKRNFMMKMGIEW